MSDTPSSSPPVAGDNTEILIVACASIAGGIVLLVGFSLLTKQLTATAGASAGAAEAEGDVAAALTTKEIVDILVPLFEPRSSQSAGELCGDEEFQIELAEKQKTIQRDRRRLQYALRSRPGEDPVKYCAC